MKKKITTPAMILKKRIPNESGDILVRLMNIEGVELKNGLNIVEMMYLYSGESGCVIGFYELRQIEERWRAEFREVDDRLTTTNFDEGVLEEALKWGRKIVDVIKDFYL